MLSVTLWLFKNTVRITGKRTECEMHFPYIPWQSNQMNYFVCFFKSVIKYNFNFNRKPKFISKIIIKLNTFFFVG